MRKKICFLQYDLAGGGAERKVCTLANYFVSKNYSVEIGLFGRNTVMYDLDKDVKLTFIRRNSYEYKNRLEKLIYNLKCLCQKAFVYMPALVIEKTIGKITPSIKQKINAERVIKHYEKINNYIKPLHSYIINRQDCVFITMMSQSYLEVIRQMESYIENGNFNAPYIVMECNNPIPGMDISEELAKMRDIWYPWASKCVSMTQGCVDCFNKNIREKSVIIPNPVRDDLPEPYIGERKKTIVNYCRLSKQKNLPLLIDAFDDFYKIHPDYQLFIYGEGELREELIQKVEDMGLVECVTISDFDSHVHQKIIDAGMYVSTSDWEGFPNSVLEALSIGLPVISTDCDFGPRDLIENNVNGILVPTNDADALCEAMCKIADDDEFSERISREAIKTREEYSVDKIGRQWIDLIENVAKENSI